MTIFKGTEAQKRELIEKVTKLIETRFSGDYLKMGEHYDKNNDRKINKDELSELLKDASIGNWITRKFWVSGVMDALDTDKDGTISLPEFEKALLSGGR